LYIRFICASALMISAHVGLAAGPAQSGTNMLLPSSAYVPSLMREALVPGLQVATINHGRIESIRSFGVGNVDVGNPVTTQTVFEAASLGKPVFAYGVLKLAGEGRIDLTAPVGRYLPDLKGPVAKLTPRQLLSHTGGLPNGGGKLDPSTSDIGRFSYSGEGFGLLQRAVEAITGQPLNQYMTAAVFKPLRMTSSSYVWREEFRATKAFGHGFTGSNAGRNHIPQARAQSSLETTAGDYARFMLAMVNRESLSPEIGALAFEPQVQLETGCIDCLGKPRGPTSATMSWGLGWGLEQTAAGPFAWHWGDNNSMQGYAAIALDGSRGVVIFANSANGHSIMPAIATKVLGVDAPGYAWLGAYAPYTDPSRRLLARIVRNGIGSIRRSDLNLPRADLIQVAQRLLEGGKTGQAAKLLRRLPGGPKSAAELSLIADAERRSGMLGEARRDARAALRLDPNTKDAQAVLDKIAMSARVVPVSLLDRYAGRYASPFGPLVVARNGEHLVAKFEDQPSSEMFPISNDRFLIETINLPIEFVVGADGQVTHAIVHAGSPVKLERLHS
jgi:CubicO group peptidase (beta-lactamase class C family)